MNDAKGSSKAKSPTQVLNTRNTQRRSGCTLHTIMLRNKVATKRATRYLCPPARQKLVGRESFTVLSVNGALQILCVLLLQRRCRNLQNRTGWLNFSTLHIDGGHWRAVFGFFFFCFSGKDFVFMLGLGSRGMSGGGL